MKGNTLLLKAALGGLLLASSACSTQGSREDRKEMGAGGGHETLAKGECHGVNTCKGKGDCGGAGYSCAGKNSCKGQGWLRTSQEECDDKGGEFKE